MKKILIVLLLATSFSSYSQEKDSLKVINYLFDLNLDNKEFNQMRSNLYMQRMYYKALHKTHLAYDVEFPLVFTPKMNMNKIPQKQTKIKWDLPKKVKLPKDKSELAFYSVGELAYLIKNKKITSVELTKFFLERLKKHNETLHCLITPTDSLALAQAEQADREIAKGKYRGPLHGIPYGAKDLLSTKNYKTTWGATPFKDQYIDYDAEVIKKLEAAGAVLIGKLTLGALAMDDVWFGERTRNPWNTEEGSSGSSAGSASAVAAGLVPFAIGTETYGSIVSPSTVCGVNGLRPTYGRVSRDGAMVVSWSMDKIGPMCRNAADLALVFDAIRGADGKDLSVHNYPFNYNYNSKNVKHLKVAYFADIDKFPYYKNDSLAVQVLAKAGIKMSKKEMPTNNMQQGLLSILFAESAASFDELTRSDRDSLLVMQGDYSWPNLYRASRLVPAVEYIQANRLRSKLTADYNKMMEDIDVLIIPTMGMAQSFTNFSGHPVVVVPIVDYSTGEKGSICFMGNHFDEASILMLARYFQELTNYEDIHPKNYK